MWVVFYDLSLWHQLHWFSIDLQTTSIHVEGSPTSEKILRVVKNKTKHLSSALELLKTKQHLLSASELLKQNKALIKCFRVVENKTKHLLSTKKYQVLKHLSGAKNPFFKATAICQALEWTFWPHRNFLKIFTGFISFCNCFSRWLIW